MDDQVAEGLTRLRGSVRQEVLGQLDSGAIQRFASACGYRRSIYSDPDAALAEGYAGLVAPPNMLSAIGEWGTGVPDGELNVDGTPSGGWFGQIKEGVAVLGGDEAIRCFRPAIAGDIVTRTRTVSSVEFRPGKSGPLCILRFEDRYVDQESRVILTAGRGVVIK